MKKTIVLLTLAIFLVGGTVILCNVQDSHARSMIIPDGDNKVCPVTGAEITAKKASTVYEGKRYWFSSYAAVQEFKKNPAKYADKLGATMPTATKAAKSRY